MSKPIEACHQGVGVRIRLIRETLELTQDDLSQRIKMTRDSIANIEIGHQRLLLHNVEEFARVVVMIEVVAKKRGR